MDEQTAFYISTLLDEKEREVEKKQNEFRSLYKTEEEEKFFAWGQELSWERHMIYEAKKAMDSLIKEKESIKWTKKSQSI